MPHLDFGDIARELGRRWHLLSPKQQERFKTTSSSAALKAIPKSAPPNKPIAPPKQPTTRCPGSAKQLASFGWNCAQCTFRNFASIKVCDMCSVPRPGVAAGADPSSDSSSSSSSDKDEEAARPVLASCKRRQEGVRPHISIGSTNHAAASAKIPRDIPSKFPRKPHCPWVFKLLKGLGLQVRAAQTDLDSYSVTTYPREEGGVRSCLRAC